MTRAFLTALAILTLAGPAAAADGVGDEVWPPTGGQVVDGIVAVVNKELVTRYDLDQAIGPFVAQMQARGQAIGPAQRERIREEVLEGLVNDMLILDEAREMKLEVQSSQVDEQVTRLKTDNGWGDDELAQALSQHGFPTISAYRAHMEKELLKNQVLSIKVASKVQVDEDEVMRVYTKETAGSTTLTQRRAAHILLRLDEFTTGDQEAAAQAKLLDLRAKATGGEESFEELARRHSQDTNAASGGDLGWFSKGDLDPTFEEAVWKLEEGEISPPVRTAFGYHLVRLTGARTKSKISEEEEEGLIRQIRFRLREKELERLYLQWIKGIRAESYVEVRRDMAGLE